MQVNSAIAKLVAAVVSVVFVASGVYQFFPSNVRPSMLGVALLVSGTAILFGRSWGYYIAYLEAFSSLMSPQRIWLVPIAAPVRRTLRLYAGIEPELINILLSLLCAGSLGWTHYVLHQTHKLDRPLSLTDRRRAAIAAFLISIALVILPTLKFIYLLVIDPPGSGVPAAPGGGMKAFYSLYRNWPLVLVGLIGAGVSLAVLKRMHRVTK